MITVRAVVRPWQGSWWGPGAVQKVMPTSAGSLCVP